MSPVFLTISVFVFAVAAIVGGFLGISKLPAYLQQRRLSDRIGQLSQTREEVEQHAGLVKTQKDGFIEKFAARSARGSALARWLEQSGVRFSMGGLLLMSLALAVVLGLVTAIVLRMQIGWIIGGAVGVSIPFYLVSIKRRRRMRSFEESFPEALDLISRALKAGHAFATGLKMVADELDEPIGPEFRKTFEEQNFGLPLKDALGNLTERVPLLDVRFFSTAVLIQRETGGNLSEILENLAHVVRERFKILRQVRVYTAHGRLTGYVLLGLPAFVAMALCFINPEHIQLLFRERMGQIMLTGAIVMQILGYFWIKQVVKIEV